MVRFVSVCVVLVVAGSTAGQGRLSDEVVGKAIEKGAAFLLRSQRGDGSWRDPGHMGLQIIGNDRQVGATGLVGYALLAKGVRVSHPKMAKTLTWLEEQRTGWTYSVSLRTQAWAEAARQTPQLSKYRRLLYADARTLIRAGARGPKPPGSYGYRVDFRVEGDKRAPLKDHDPSNGQYGVLGVWAAYQLQGEVPKQYWKYVMQYWAGRQEGDGGWKYSGGDKQSTGTMTTAGLATLFVCVDALMASRFVRCQRSDEIALLRKGLDWFDRNFERTLHDEKLCHGGHGDTYYYLFGVERVGLASGRKYFGRTDWYKVGASWLLSRQNKDGSWSGRWGPDVATAYALLFLVRGQHAVLFNRLEYDGDWNNRPRGLANFCRWARSAFEQSVYWQIINLKVDVSQWHDAPILLITGSVAPKFTDGELGRLRRYVQEGGTILSVTECAGKGFQEGIREVYKKLFPRHKLTELPPNHALYQVHGKVPATTKFSMVSNGGRPLAIHTDTDIAVDWQLNRWLSSRGAFDAAANVAMYVTGKRLRHRGTHGWPKKPPRAGGPTVKLARLRHGGNYDPEPLAWQRVARRIAPDCKVNLDVAGPIRIGELKGSGAKIATLTGTSALTLSGGEKAALKDFVEKGGLLLVDATGGSRGGGAAFSESAEALLRELFGRRSLRTLSTEADLLRLPGRRIERVQYRLKTKLVLGTTEPRLKAVMVNGRVGVVFSREDLTVALVGCTPVGCDGYAPESAYKLVRNIILYVAKPPKAARR